MKEQLKHSSLTAVASLTLLLFAGCDDDADVREFVIRSPAFGEKEAMPSKYACGAGISPPISFSLIPDKVESIVLIAEDKDRISGVYTHWIMWNLPSRIMIHENISDYPIDEAILGTADDEKTVGYLAPCPPKGETHKIVFKAYGLDTHINLEEGASREQLNKTIQNHIVAKASLTALAIGSK